jgi:hypothetical protein
VAEILLQVGQFLQTITSTPNGSYTATVAAQSVTLVGLGNEIGNDGTDSVQVTMTVTLPKLLQQ